MKGKKFCNYHLDPVCVQDNKGEEYHACCRRLAACQIATWHKWEQITPEFDDRHASFIETSAYDAACIKRKAVVVDCEMVGMSDGFGELARLCAVDYVTGEVLIDYFVDPVGEVLDYRTNWSGVTKEKIAEAKDSGNCLPNWSSARDALLKFVDAKTIIVGSGLRHDLEVLRLVHTNVVDSALISQQNVGRPQGIKALCKEMLGRNIQQGNNGHDPLEDCMATREVILWMTYGGKSKFDEWVIFAKRRIAEEREKQRAQEIDKRKEKEHDPRKIAKDVTSEEAEAGGLTEYQREEYG